jgi:hypothetical protein
VKWSFYIFAALVIVFLGFGVASLMDPITSIVLTAPWLVEIFVLGRIVFALTWYQYFSFALGGAIVVTLLTMRRRMEQKNKRAALKVLFASSIIVLAVLLTALEPLFIWSANTNSYSQCFLFQVNATQRAYYSELDYVIARIPRNASLMAPYFTIPHVYAREYLEVIGPTPNSTDVWFAPNLSDVWFPPQYILTDYNQNISLNANTANSGNQSFLNQINAGKYVLYASNGTAMLYRLNRT